ncbi:MAG: hypothetical protein WAW87_08870 [Candidatus Ferrigenium altingense]
MVGNSIGAGNAASSINATACGIKTGIRRCPWFLQGARNALLLVAPD